MNTVIVGLGVTGFAVAEYLNQEGARYTIVDTRENPPKLEAFKALYPDIAVHTGGFPADVIRAADRIILSPGIAKEHPDLQKNLSKGVEIIGDIELFARVNQKPVVAITGSNGKSTVTSLVGAMAKASGIAVGVGGNLGTPALQLFMNKPSYDLFVLELSSFQLETTDSLKPTVATVLNLSPDHLDRYPDMEAYKTAKSRIFKSCQQVVYNRQDPILPKEKAESMLSFGLDEPQMQDKEKGALHFGLRQKDNEFYLAEGHTFLLPVKKLKLFGKHNIANALAALALGKSIDLPLPSMLSVLETFTGLPHRCEWVKNHHGIPWINDSKGTNVGATASAILGLANDITGQWILIAGGLGKNADFSPLNPLIQQHCRAVVLIGEEAEALQSLWGPLLPCLRADNMRTAVQMAAEAAKPGDGVLLSPACASYDMFRDFEDRGNAFRLAVADLK